MLTVLITVSALFYVYANDITATPPTHTTPSFETAFSPKQGATKLIIKTINRAEKSIKVAAYSFTSKPIAQALIDASKRGVAVKIILDKSQVTERHSLLPLLFAHNIDTRISTRYTIMHNKFMIIDEKTLELGSFNYSKSAEERNAENVLVIHNQIAVVHQYSLQWQKLWDDAENNL